MIQSELIEELSQNFPFLKNDMGLCVKTIENEMINHLAKNGRIEIRGFGSFEVRYRRPRTARNPKTGETFITKPKSTIHFKPGQNTKESINAARHKYPIKKLNSKKK